MIPWLIIMILILIIILVILFFVVRKGKKAPTDYYGFYIIGIIWLAFGIPFKNYSLMVMGFIFALIGLLNKDKWKKNRPILEKLSKEQRKLRMIAIFLLTILLLVGIVFLILSKNDVL